MIELAKTTIVSKWLADRDKWKIVWVVRLISSTMRPKVTNLDIRASEDEEGQQVSASEASLCLLF